MKANSEVESPVDILLEIMPGLVGGNAWDVMWWRKMPFKRMDSNLYLPRMFGGTVHTL